MKKPYLIQLSQDSHAELKIIAARRGVSMQSLILDALNRAGLVQHGAQKPHSPGKKPS